MASIERINSSKRLSMSNDEIDICLGRGDDIEVSNKYDLVASHPSVRSVILRKLSPDHFHLNIDVFPNMSVSDVRADLEQLVGRKCHKKLAGKSVNKGIINLE
ncbi:hypothetical protein IC627_05905 [Photobacterium damselae subsp. piscicida]|uniref:Uncharacterized protein n=2 Tax=Photobacterium damsela subsp. piscicida TaxID=38294 RepID=A0A7L8A685_PHODP|nr:hypothetical protein [Photobacterium damselae]MBE8128950.1 hypothetical protein [Photobacterium damselae subsp. piscicida]QOD53633.1 hypothetical protein IC628_05885 [Photobacterium damselae subsp. piscicida]QOD57470.1 hypothetical protein IC627_05905 [Photobacterium damselae subsp. piscicida]